MEPNHKREHGFGLGRRWTFRRATRDLSEIAFGIPKMAALDYVERRRILARSCAFAGYMADVKGFTVWK
jgi:hypothetical protein